jgi:hypothetical protein
VRNILLDDGASEQRAYGLEATIGARQVAFVVPAAEFSRMGWVGPQLGPQAIIYPGQQQHARAAIQSLSGEIHTHRIFTHLGWRKQDGKWVYLQAAGALGSPGMLDGCEVQLPAALHGYQLPAEAIATLDANFPWLHGAERRTGRLRSAMRAAESAAQK